MTIAFLVNADAQKLRMLEPSMDCAALFGGNPKMVETAVLTLADGVRIAVPDLLSQITPYVLREQGDYFEDELSFVRELLQPGRHVIDIGANYGVYTLPMAQRVGPSGHVWAFEPSSSTAKFLAEGIGANGFANVTLEQKAVSNSSGGALLSLHHNSELNTIVHGPPPEGDTERVSLVTLDECMDRYHWTDIELIKIDAEGEESNIVKGGPGFFSSLEPLVQYELRMAEKMNLELIDEFEALGYDSYRLVPGLNLLIPFDVRSEPDPYLLNLFCCKPTKAEQLAARGVLLRSADFARTPSLIGSTTAGLSETEVGYHWASALGRLPYATPLSKAWRAAEDAGKSAEIIHHLSLYSRSRDVGLSPLDRFRALEAAFVGFKAVCQREPSRLRLASLARAAHDYGARRETVRALKQLLGRIHQAGVDPNEPFLPPLERFDWIPLGEESANWVVAAILEQLEKREYYSTFYAGPTARERLEDIHALGFGSPEMERRLELVRQRIEEARRRA